MFSVETTAVVYRKTHHTAVHLLTYSNHLNTGQVWYSNDPNIFGCQLVLFSNGGLKPDKNVCYKYLFIYLVGVNKMEHSMADVTFI